MKVWAGNKQGFTIVELLIVIVVIAILAAITVVAYNGIQNRAKDTSLQSASSQAGKKVLAYAPLNTDLFPQEASFRADLALPVDSDQATYDYYVSDDRKRFCLSVTNTTTNPVSSYAYTQNGNMVAGRCVKNLVINPSFEAGVAGWVYANSASGVVSTGAKQVGDNGVAVTTASTSDSGIGRSFSFLNGKIYTFSCMFQSKATANYIYKTSAQATGLPSAGTVTRSLVPEQQARVSSTWTMPSDATGMLYCLRSGGQSGSSMYNVDGVMLTETNILYSYGDGDSSNWSWTGTANTSTSFGPALPQ